MAGYHMHLMAIWVLLMSQLETLHAWPWRSADTTQAPAPFSHFASPTGEDYCKDRPFKEWHRELQHMANTFEEIFGRHHGNFEVSWLRKKFANDAALRENNPCAIQVRNGFGWRKFRKTRFFVEEIEECKPDDAKCAELVLSKMSRMVQAYILVLLDTLEERRPYHDHILHLLPHPVIFENVERLKLVEESASMKQKTEFFDLFRKALKVFALGIPIEYPVTLSGAVCEKDPIPHNVVPILEKAGDVIGDKIRRFLALPKTEQARCASNEAMWKENDCGAEIMKTYSKMEDPGDCSHFFTSATGKCRTSLPAGWNDCAAAVRAMRDGFECYLTKLARDPDSVESLALLEKEANDCVRDGWLRVFETAPKDQELVAREEMEMVYPSYKRLELLSGFGCIA